MQGNQGFNKKLLIIVLIAAVVIIGGGFWYWQKSGEVQAPVSVEKTPEQKVEELGGKILESVQNPIKEELPEINPFKPQTNPFGNETNPFQETYKNPFE
ncbi:MAG: hypothetical protein A3G49_00705 [Candidatus Sungbacteria bacterium RIFCSPLOWO2_12_FULL_41_11]|uniref:Uncharacterized protein n=1 Tax=Candidatus Sungbacteria bacterium RIFCSPLOWO2_12_FULL_41_11 TaxID=1802286 RepID=A0A1G2LNY4_9BACT|nr:MAG: hypothetical protein UV01_C0014G0003 [Parcubacteria group bacterium GW2011_GWA2_42_14]OGZ99113.1 MAG: hypothetical protein A3D41_04235 [Candidatus Sungbacteria bacterium RIFCSPHIGHO2_02_FULL_41_12b]OHA13316.1 MAG: hypothetical protein A3G49_00705 [Candidatus Sungbacteria bacterium RIFCSPLOWO2_12_FULL_41_11]